VLMDKILAVGNIQHKYAIRLQAVLSRARKRSTNDTAAFLGINLDSMNGRFVEHFIPTHSSWLNIVERWFGEITNKRIRRDSWSGVNELEKAIGEYIRHWNKSGRIFEDPSSTHLPV
jgi:transposase